MTWPRLLSILLPAAILTGCTPPDTPARPDLERARATCARLARTDTAPASGFPALLDVECQAALGAMEAGSPPQKAWDAYRLIQAMETYTRTMSLLDTPPRASGAYLIAAESGLTDMLDLWLAWERETHLAKLQKIQSFQDSS